MKVRTSGTAAFTVTSRNTPTVWNANGSNTATISWNVEGENTAPVNTSNVDILLSTDGGFSFPYTLLPTRPMMAIRTFPFLLLLLQMQGLWYWL